MANSILNEIPVIPDAACEKQMQEEHAAQRKKLHAMGQQWEQDHAEAVEARFAELIADSPHPAKNEATVLRLSAGLATIAEAIEYTEAQLAARMERLVDNPKVLLLVARALRETARTHTSTVRSVHELLQAASTLNAQRRLMDQHERKWHADDWGARGANPRRDPTARPATPN